MPNGLSDVGRAIVCAAAGKVAIAQAVNPAEMNAERSDGNNANFTFLDPDLFNF